MQSGHVRVNGRWWILKVREWVVKDGVKRRVDAYKKLRLVRHNENGRAVPHDVQALANVELAKVNVGEGQGQSADSVKAYLERFLKAGVGRSGRPLEVGTINSYRRDYRAIADFIPDVQMRQVRTPDINRIFRSLVEQDGDGDDMRATSSYRNIRNFLSGAFRAAVGEGAIDFNPVRDAMVLSGNDSDTHAYTMGETRSIYGEELAAHRTRNSGDGFIFHPEGQSQSVLNFEHMVFDTIRPALVSAGIEWHGLHAFRRGLNAAMTELGVDKSTRVDVMRHEHRDVTDKHYGKASLTQMRLALEKVEGKYKKELRRPR
jgi:hypothetical protein